MTHATTIICFCLFLSFPIHAHNDNIELEQFENFLTQSLTSKKTNKAQIDKFYQHTWSFWMAQKEDYNLHPEKYDKIMPLFHKNQQMRQQNNKIEINRYDADIEKFIQLDQRNSFAEDAILFVGSSSIRYWETANAFPKLPIINRGFGGASLPEIVYYYDDVIKKHKPSMLVVYCDIDVEAGKSPTFAVNAFKKLINKVEQDFPTMPVLLLSMKPTLIDDVLGENVRNNKILTNKMLDSYAKSKENIHFVDITSDMLTQDDKLKTEIFLEDGMHLNTLGYKIWNPILQAEFNRIQSTR
jgi:lysophospholipase L1-like esterase